MNHEERVARVRRLVASLRPEGGLESAFTRSAADGLREEAEAAAPATRTRFLSGIDGLDRLRRGEAIDPAHLEGLEAIILPRERPAVAVRNGRYDPMPAPWEALDTPEARARIEPALRSVGRVEIPLHPGVPYAGTGFIVGPDLLLTNRHVAELFVRGLADRVVLRTQFGPQVDFVREVEPSEPAPLIVTAALWIHPWWDAALLRVEGLPADRPPLRLDPIHPADLLGRDLVVVGYPALDPRNDIDIQNQVFGGVYQVKRVQPGRGLGSLAVRSFEHTVDALGHDSSTLGGNSGSVVLDARTGRAVGLHFSGTYLVANHAVPAWALAQDRRVWDSGVVFADGAGAPAEAAAWAGEWSGDEAASFRAAPTSTPDATPTSSVPAPAARAASERLRGDGYERLDDNAIAALFVADPDGTRAALADTLGAAEADALIDTLVGGTEGLIDAGELPTLVFLPGLLGVHLADTGGSGGRVWLDPIAMVTSDIGERLALRADGVTEVAPQRLAPNGVLRLVYGKALRTWRTAGFDVRTFAYDWRKSMFRAADELATLLDALWDERPDRAIVLVGHSMGGVVASTWAANHPDSAAKITRAVFVGSPLAGSYAPLEAGLGTYPFLRALAGVSGATPASLRAMAVSLPGLLELLPDPAVLPDAAPLYDAANWPTPAPTPAVLDRARTLKHLVGASPLFARTTAIVSATSPTVDRVVRDGTRLVAGPRTGRGDGTVPIDGAAVAGLAAVLHIAGPSHSTLLKHPAVIQAVADLARKGRTRALPAYDPAKLAPLGGVEAVATPADTARVDPDRVDEVRTRFAAGTLRAEDVDWLLGGALPDDPTENG